MVKKIKLSQGKYTLIDDEDYERVSQYKWCTYYSKHTSSFYAVRGIRLSNGKWTTQQMHRFIMNVPNGLHIDHINHDTLDNRKENLRVVTNSQNQMNQKKHRTYAGKKTSSIYKGVYWDKQHKKWRAYIQVNGKLIYLGSFRSEDYAALVYNRTARHYFGKYALINEV